MIKLLFPLEIESLDLMDVTLVIEGLKGVLFLKLGKVGCD